MAYGSIDGVNALLPNQLMVNATSDPTTTQVQLWIDQCDASVNVALKAGGATAPATDPDVQKAAALLVNTEVARRVVVKKTNAEEDDDTAFDRALKAMRAGEWGAGAAGSTVEARSGTYDDVSAFPKSRTRNW